MKIKLTQYEIAMIEVALREIKNNRAVLSINAVDSCQNLIEKFQNCYKVTLEKENEKK